MDNLTNLPSQSQTDDERNVLHKSLRNNDTRANKPCRKGTLVTGRREKAVSGQIYYGRCRWHD